MKKTLWIIAMILAFTSCMDKNEYKATVSFPEDLEGEEVFLRRMDFDNMTTVVLDSAKVTNGQVLFKGTIGPESPEFARVQLSERNPRYRDHLEFVLENGDIKLQFDTVHNVSGTSKNFEFQSYMTARNKISKESSLLWQEYQAAKDDANKQEEIVEKRKALNIEKGLLDEEYITRNKDNMLSVMSILDNFYELDLAASEKLIAGMPEEYQNLADIKRLSTFIEARKNTAEGQKYLDAEGEDKDGKARKLSEFVKEGNVTLIDFWGSWCGPCIASLPGLKESYEKYKSEGFEIVAIATDNKEAWLGAIEKYELEWIHMLDAKEEFSKVYGVYYYPHTVLLDRNGTVIAKDLNAVELNKRLEELFDTSSLDMTEIVEKL